MLASTVMRRYLFSFFILPFSLVSITLLLFCLTLTSTYAQYEQPTSTPTPNIPPPPPPTIYIHGWVFNDVDQSGFYWSPDTPYWNWEVRLYNGSGTYLQSQYTDGSGYYKFSTLLLGTYTVSISPPAGFRPTTPTSYTEYFGTDSRRDFGTFFPPPPTVSPNPPSTSCSGNNPRVQIDYTTTASWIRIYWNGDGSLLYDGAPTGQYIHTLSPAWSGSGGIQYSIRGFANAPPGGSDNYSETTTTPLTLPNCYYSISGTVYIDYNRNGILDGVDTAYSSGTTITLSGAAFGSQVTGAPGTYSFTTLLSGNYTVSRTLPAGYVATTGPLSYTPLSSVMVNQHFGMAPYYMISGTVFIDYEGNGSNDVGYPSGSTVTLTGTESYTGNAVNTPTTSNASGVYAFNNIYAGNYTTTLSMASFPANRYQGVTTSNNMTLPPSAGNQDFTVIPLYQISGNIFNDTNKNGLLTGGESTMGGSYDVQIVGPGTNTTTTTNTGTFTFSQLREGTYTIALLTNPPAGYRMTDPLNGPPPTRTVTIGRTCNVTGANGAACVAAPMPFTAYDVSNVNFGMTNNIPWFQCIGSSCRIDGGIVNDGTNNAGFTDTIPDNPGATCGVPYAAIPGTYASAPGVLYSDGSIDLGPRGDAAASTTGWIVENDPFSSSANRTSYEFAVTTLRQSGITPLDLAAANRCGAGGLSNCSLDPNLPSGIYQANGNVNINAYTFQNNRNYVFLINGDLYINGEIKIQVGSTAFFTVSGDITVDQNIGVNNVCSATPNVEGIYSADGSFIIDGINNCAIGADKRFNLAGAIIVDAAGTTNGQVNNRRDLCNDDRNAPAFSIMFRPDLVLYIPDFVKYKSDAWREVAP